jgi:hypothetical protein
MDYAIENNLNSIDTKLVDNVCSSIKIKEIYSTLRDDIEKIEKEEINNRLQNNQCLYN